MGGKDYYYLLMNMFLLLTVKLIPWQTVLGNAQFLTSSEAILNHLYLIKMCLC